MFLVLNKKLAYIDTTSDERLPLQRFEHNVDHISGKVCIVATDCVGLCQATG